jgi:hypothetical protein
VGQAYAILTMQSGYADAAEALDALLIAGKTSLLRHVLENSKEKVACIVNDVASINIDAKLVRNDRNKARSDNVNSTSDLADTVELANGCACEYQANGSCLAPCCID